MTGNPVLLRAEAYKIIDMKINQKLGSKWDSKVHTDTKLKYPDLRHKVGEAVVRGKMSVRRAAETFSVSTGFVSKWSRIFECRDNLNSDYHKCTKQVFLSTSNRPKKVVSPIRDEIREKVVELRKKYDFLGSAKIKRMLKLNVSCSTVDKVIREEGLAGKLVRRARNKTYGKFERQHPFSMVQIDYKHWGEGICSIWIIDDATRMILGHHVSDHQSAEDVIELLESTFEFWHIKPQQILSDHGSEFYSIRGGKGRSRLDRWCKEKGIQHILGRVRHPQTQGKIERSHRSAITEIEAFGSMETLDAARETISKWVAFYNTERPHQALGYECPFDAFVEKLEGDCLSSFVEG